MVCKLLPMIHQEFQSYSEISQWTQRNEWMKMERRTPKSIWRIKRQDHKSTSTCSSKERWKIQGGNRYFRICDQRSLIPRTRNKIETYCFLIKNNTTGWKELQDIWQGITCYSENFDKMETILIRHYREIQSLDRP